MRPNEEKNAPRAQLTVFMGLLNNPLGVLKTQSSIFITLQRVTLSQNTSPTTSPESSSKDMDFCLPLLFFFVKQEEDKNQTAGGKGTPFCNKTCHPI